MLHVMHGTVGRPGRVKSHAHAFWQLDAATKGSFAGWAGALSCRLALHEALLVPPHVRHGFEYDEPGARFLAFKFKAKGAGLREPLRVGRTPRQRAILAALLAAAGDSGVPGEKRQAVLNPLMAALLAEVTWPDADEEAPSLFLKQVRAFVREARGRPVVLADLAAHVGYSAGHTSALFREQTGQSLKAWLDEERAAVARELLAFADLSVSQIADTLDFPDLYAFSRFFKRMEGASPRAYIRAFAEKV